MVAHNFRIYDTSFFSDDLEKLEYHIPNTNSEKNLMDGIIYLMCWNISSDFPDIISGIDPEYTMLDKLKIKCSQVDNEKELTDLFEKWDKVLPTKAIQKWLF